MPDYDLRNAAARVCEGLQPSMALEQKLSDSPEETTKNGTIDLNSRTGVK